MAASFSSSAGAEPLGYSLYILSSSGSAYSTGSIVVTSCPRSPKARSRYRTARMPRRSDRTDPKRRTSWSDMSKHRVRVGSALRNALQHIPVLHDSALCIEPKDVHARSVVAVRPLLVAVENHIVPLADHAPEFDPLAGILATHPLEIRDKGVRAVRHRRVVLGIGRPDIPFNGLGRPVLIEHQVVERRRIRFVLLEAHKE